ncbi:MAG: hypothetical protein EB120_01460 [Proteobacteria bacterium]|nr:hypothetical protein [Pseudomonadota bacterium]
MAELMDPNEFLKQTEFAVPPARPQAEQPSLMDPNDFLKQTEFVEFEGLGPKAAALGAGVARGVTFGLSDLALRMAGANPEYLRKLQEYQPGLSLTGEITGALAPALVTGGTAGVATAARIASAPVRAVSAIGAATEAAVAKKLIQEGTKASAKTIVQNYVPKIAGSAVEGALYGAGQVISDAALGDPDLTAQNALATIGLSSIIGSGVGAIGQAAVNTAKGISESVSPYVKNWTQRLVGLDEETIRTINQKGEKVTALANLGETPDEVLLKKAEDVAKQFTSARNQAIDDLNLKATEVLAPIANKPVSVSKMIDVLENAKNQISPNDLRLNPEIASSLKQIDDVIDATKAIGFKNLNIPTGQEAAQTIKSASDSAFEDFISKRDEFLKPIWNQLQTEAKKLRRDPEAVAIKPYLQILNKTKKQFEIKGVAVGGPASTVVREIDGLIDNLQTIAKKSMGLDPATKFAAKDLYIQGGDLVPLKKLFQDSAEYVYEIGKTSPQELMYKSLAAKAKQDLDQLSPAIKSLNAKLKESIEASQALSRFGFTKRAGDSPELRDKFQRLLQMTEKDSVKFSKAIREIDKLYNTNIESAQKFVSMLARPKNIPTGNLLLNASQIEEIRRQLLSKLVAINPESKLYSGVLQSYNSIINELKKAGASEITDISKQQIGLLKNLNILKRYGFNSEDLDPTKVKDFLLTSTRKSEKDFQASDELRKILGVDLVEEREIAKAYYNISKQAPLARLGTGASTLIPAIGGLAGYGLSSDPTLGALGFIAGATLQNPKNLPKVIAALSKAQQKTAKISDSIARFGGNAASFIPPNSVPYVSSLVSSMIMLERQNQKIDSQISSAINGFLNQEIEESFPTSVGLMKQTSFTRPYSRSIDDRVDAFNKRLNELVEVGSDVAILNDRLVQNTWGLSQAAPNVTAALNARAIQATQFLLSKAPQNPVADPLQASDACNASKADSTATSASGCSSIFSTEPKARIE